MSPKVPRALALVSCLYLVACSDDSSGGISDVGGPRGASRDAGRTFADVGMSPRDAASAGPRDVAISVSPEDSAWDAEPECRLNSDCDPGRYCGNAGRCTFDCRVDRDCDPGLHCDSGECIPTVAECQNDGQCNPPARICQGGECVDGCGRVGCGNDLTCNQANGHCERVDPGFDCRRGDRCPEGADCDEATGQCRAGPQFDCRRGDACAGDTICDAETGQCRPPPPFDCRHGDECAAGAICDGVTGQCRAGPQGGALGADCDRAADCDSSICAALSINGIQSSVCAQPCCSEIDCPLGFGCNRLNGVRLCVPSRAYPDGFTFDAIRGQSCGRGARACQSGVCDVRDDECVGICCTDRDCNGLMCKGQASGDSQIAVCGISLGFGGIGDRCESELDCQSGVCILLQDGTASCTEMCCTNRDCPGDLICGQVGGPDRVPWTSACAPGVRGDLPEGDRCDREGDCQSGFCIEGTCAEPCCNDADCFAPRRCLPRNNGEGSLVRVCALPDP